MNPAIRRANVDDADFIAWTILMAQRGHRPRGWFDIMLGWSELECLAFVRGIAIGPVRSWWHVSRFWIAEIDGEPAAALCAQRSGGALTAAREALGVALRTIGMGDADQSALMRRGAYAGKCWVQGDDSNWFIEHVATRPAYRGQGLSSALLEHALAEGGAAGCKRAAIPFYIGNDAAESCYAKAGFRFAEEKRDPGFEALTGSPGFRRFERPI
jgi:GNAT superfamily N-acetyltransferase